ncbi:hypothetical protein D3C80_1868090 [compost metagenome]
MYLAAAPCHGLKFMERPELLQYLIQTLLMVMSKYGVMAPRSGRSFHQYLMEGQMNAAVELKIW